MPHNHSTTTTHTSLESVAQQFAHWRETRNKKEKIPDSLLALITPLLKQYSRNKIASALRISYAHFKQVSPVSPSFQQKPPSFFECSLATPLLPIEQCRIEFTCKNGSPVKISGLTSPQIQALVSLLLGN
jgi:hypothetical protein